MIVQSNLKPDFIKSFTAIQKEIQNVVKNSNNPFYNSKYADLSAVWDEIKDKAIDNGFCIQQTMYINESGENCLKVRLLHECGDFIDSDMKLLLAKNDMQAIGSAITYARRYLLMAMFGICPEDDDGNATTLKREPEKEKITQTQLGEIIDSLNAIEEKESAFLKRFKISKLEDLPRDEFKTAIAAIEARGKAKKEAANANT